MARVYNSKHNFLANSAAALQCSESDLAAVFSVESAGNGFNSNGRMMIRFENHVFYSLWATTPSRKAQFHQHFDFRRDSHKYQDHKFRLNPNGGWQKQHTGSNSQDLEWKALQFAQSWDDTAALKSTAFGSAQIMGKNYATLHYPNVQAMFTAFSKSIHAQMKGLVSFIAGNRDCVSGLRSGDMVQFAGCYNGHSKEQEYGNLISTASQDYDFVQKRTLCSVNNALGVCFDTTDSSQTCTGTVADAGSSGCADASFACCVVAVNTETGSYDGQRYGACTAGSNNHLHGSCIDATRCAGTTYAGRCPHGPSNVQCCVRDPCLSQHNQNGGGGTGNGVGSTTGDMSATTTGTVLAASPEVSGEDSATISESEPSSVSSSDSSSNGGSMSVDMDSSQGSSNSDYNGGMMDTVQSTDGGSTVTVGGEGVDENDDSSHMQFADDTMNFRQKRQASGSPLRFNRKAKMDKFGSRK